MSYSPTEEDLAFAREMIRIASDHGYWGLPSSGLGYQFDKPNKTLYLTMGDQGHWIHEANKITFGRLGWKVEDSPPENDSDHGSKSL